MRVRRDGREESVRAGAVVLASGGFQANTEMRTKYLGPGWDLAKVRGTRFNTGDGITMALEAGAMSWGNWSGAHAVSWDLNAPPFGDPAVGDGFQKHSYPFGIVVNGRGQRFPGLRRVPDLGGFRRIRADDAGMCGCGCGHATVIM